MFGFDLSLPGVALRGRGAPPLWTPAQLGSVLVGWWDASDDLSLTKEESRIGSWQNKGTGAPSAIQANDAFRPIVLRSGINARQALYFSGSQSLNIEAFVQTAQRTIAAVFQPDNVGSGTRGVYDIDANVSPRIGQAIRQTSASVQSIAFAASGTAVTAGSGSVLAAATPNISVAHLPAAQLSLFNNGALSGAGTISGAVASGSHAASIGNAPVVAAGFVGFIGEVIHAQGAITDANRQRLEGYLAWKWGMQAMLPENHPYKSATPTA